MGWVDRQSSAGEEIFLDQRGVQPVIEREKVVCLGPTDGAGAYIVFHAPDAVPVWPYLER
jgi:hypothetical protein